MRNASHYIQVFVNTQLIFTCSKWSNRATRKRCEIRSKLTMKTPGKCQWCRSGVFVNFEYISHLILVFLLLFGQANVSLQASRRCS